MSSATSLADLQERLAAHGQAHVLRFWETLCPSGQQAFAEQLEQLDLPLLERLFRLKRASEDWAGLARRATAPPAFRLEHGQNPYSPAEAVARGSEALRAGHIGVVVVAGGQGTRLGFEHPKGMYSIGPVSGSSLLQILFEKLLAVRRRYRAAIPLYLMTSPATHAETLEFLAQNRNFGLPAEDLRVFCQGTMPAVDAQTGQLLLSTPASLALSPDGHGGMLAAMQSHGVMSDIAERGLRQLFYLQVDNPLTGLCDPEFIGYHRLAGSELSTQVVAKQAARENVGNVVQIDGQMRIIEYSDLNPLPDEIVLRTMPDGSPIFWAGNTAVHVFDVDFLQRAVADEASLPFHIAHKRVPFVDAAGKLVEPAEPNATKFERFIFDLLPAARRSIVVEVDAAPTFAPLKNAPGEPTDSPETVRKQMIALHRQWLTAAGAHLADDVEVEISPLFALDANELKQKIPPGTRITEATYFR